MQAFAVDLAGRGEVSQSPSSKHNNFSPLTTGAQPCRERTGWGFCKKVGGLRAVRRCYAAYIGRLLNRGVRGGAAGEIAVMEVSSTNLIDHALEGALGIDGDLFREEMVTSSSRWTS